MQNSPSDFLLPVIDGIPGPTGLLSALLFLTFVLHLLLMNAVVGVAAITLTAKIRVWAGRSAAVFAPDGAPPFNRNGLDRPEGPAPEQGPEYTQDTLLPKGVALTVNLGVAPFLFIQCLFARYIYVSSLLMAQWWLSVMLVVMLAYYGMYLNMARHNLSEQARTVALGLALLLLLFNAFLFVNNMTLLQSPERWSAYALQAGGSFLNLADPQLAPRYLHVVLACLAVGGLCLALPEEYALRKVARAPRASAPPDAPADASTGAPDAHSGTPEAHMAKRKAALSWFLYPSMLQVPTGLWFFLALEPPVRAVFTGGSALATALFALALACLIAALLLAARQKAFAAAACALVIVLCMAGMRSLLRAAMLAPSYALETRPFEAGPLLLFLLSLLASAYILFRLGRIYLRDKALWHRAPEAPPLPGIVVDATTAHDATGTPHLPPALSPADRRDALLVRELPRRHDEAENDENGGTTRKGGPKA